VIAEELEVERRGAVMLMRLCRPERMNALSPATSRACAEVIDAFALDDAMRVLIVTGKGDRAFCAGADLMTSAGDGERPASGFGGLTARFDLAKPVIAAVNGVALGGGFELALACDIILAADSASFGLPEPTLGLVALAGGLHRLPRAIGEKRALALLLTGERVGAEEGRRLGFVHEVVASAGLEHRAIELAEAIAAMSPAALAAIKEAVWRGMAEPTVEAAMRAQLTYPAVDSLLRSGDSREGVRAFREKRAADWPSRRPPRPPA
jgi:enoyl-CoA hydratase/carnithine racemase